MGFECSAFRVDNVIKWLNSDESDKWRRDNFRYKDILELKIKEDLESVTTPSDTTTSHYYQSQTYTYLDPV